MACKTIDYDVNTITNADRIRNMSDEELAKLLMCDGDDCDDCFRKELDWLRQPAEE